MFCFVGSGQTPTSGHRHHYSTHPKLIRKFSNLFVSWELQSRSIRQKTGQGAWPVPGVSCLVLEWRRWTQWKHWPRTMETMELGLPLVETLQVTGHWPPRHPHRGHTLTNNNNHSQHGCKQADHGTLFLCHWWQVTSLFHKLIWGPPLWSFCAWFWVKVEPIPHFREAQSKVTRRQMSPREPVKKKVWKIPH